LSRQIDHMGCAIRTPMHLRPSDSCFDVRRTEGPARQTVTWVLFRKCRSSAHWLSSQKSRWGKDGWQTCPTQSRLFGLFRPLLRAPGGRALTHVPGAAGRATLPLHGRRGPAGSIILVLRPGSRTEQGSHTAAAGGKTFRRGHGQPRKVVVKRRWRMEQVAPGSSRPIPGGRPVWRRCSVVAASLAPKGLVAVPDGPAHLGPQPLHPIGLSRSSSTSAEQKTRISQLGGPRRRPLRRKAWISHSAERCTKLAFPRCHYHPSSARMDATRPSVDKSRTEANGGKRGPQAAKISPSTSTRQNKSGAARCWNTERPLDLQSAGTERKPCTTIATSYPKPKFTA
jgi:hypothetical protein